MICLDTNAVIALLNRSSALVRARLAAAVHRREVVAISVVVLFELRYGAAKSANRQRASRRIADFLSGPVKVLDFEPDDAEEAGDIRAALERAGTPIGRTTCSSRDRRVVAGRCWSRPICASSLACRD